MRATISAEAISRRAKRSQGSSVTVASASGGMEPGSGTASSNSSPKLLDTFLADAPNTPITPFTNGDSGNNTDNTSPLDFYSQDKEVCVITPGRVSPPFVLAQRDQDVSKSEKYLPRVSAYFEKVSPSYAESEAGFVVPDISSLSCKELGEGTEDTQYEAAVSAKAGENKAVSPLAKGMIFDRAYIQLRMGRGVLGKPRTSGCLSVCG